MTSIYQIYYTFFLKQTQHHSAQLIIPSFFEDQSSPDFFDPTSGCPPFHTHSFLVTLDDFSSSTPLLKGVVLVFFHFIPINFIFLGWGSLILFHGLITIYMLMTSIFIALSLASSLKFQIHVSNCSQGPRDRALLSWPLPQNIFLSRLPSLSKLHPYLPRFSSQNFPLPSLSMCNSSVSPVLIALIFLHQYHHALLIHHSPQPQNGLHYRPLHTFVIWIFTTFLLPCPQGPEISVFPQCSWSLLNTGPFVHYASAHSSPFCPFFPNSFPY